MLMLCAWLVSFNLYFKVSTPVLEISRVVSIVDSGKKFRLDLFAGKGGPINVPKVGMILDFVRPPSQVSKALLRARVEQAKQDVRAFLAKRPRERNAREVL